MLDLVDGRVARWTGTASAFGARLDGEADAFLMLVLSVEVARTHGAWVLAMGAARYVFAMAGWVLPCMRAQPAAALLAQGGDGGGGHRPWCSPPRAWARRGGVLAALVVGALLLAESFGRDVVWLCRRASRRARHPGRDSHDRDRPDRAAGVVTGLARGAYDDALRRTRTAPTRRRAARTSSSGRRAS